MGNDGEVRRGRPHRANERAEKKVKATGAQTRRRKDDHGETIATRKEQSGGNGRLPGASGHGKRASRHRRGRKAETYSETCRKTAGISTQGSSTRPNGCGADGRKVQGAIFGQEGGSVRRRRLGSAGTKTSRQ